MKKIIVIAACALLTTAAYAADGKSKVTVAKAEVKVTVVPAAVSKPAPRAKKVSASESAVYDYSLERDACCYSHTP
jgi:hypothetical protein